MIEITHPTIKNATLDLGKIQVRIDKDGRAEAPNDISPEVLERLRSAGYKIPKAAMKATKKADPPKVPEAAPAKEVDATPAPEGEPKAIALDDLTAIKGIGEKTAEKIVDKYETYIALKACKPEKMAEDIDGLTVDLAKELLAKLA